MKLAGIAEIALLLGVSRQRAGKIAERTTFPAPIDRIACGPVWELAKVERWKAKHRG